MESSRDLKTQAALARKSGVAQSTVGRILRSDVDPQSETLQRLCRALGIHPSSLLDKLAGMEPATRGGGIALETVEKSRGVPLISWIRAGAFAESIDTYQPGHAERWMECPRPYGPRAFALRVEGESMEPSYQNGDIIYVDPDVAPVHGKDVVVRLDDRNEVTFKRLVIEGERSYLRPLNPNWPDKVIEVSADARIVGVVIGKWADR